MFKKFLAKSIEFVTFRLIRFDFPAYGSPPFSRIWTPFTYRFGHGGWIHLNVSWLIRFWNNNLNRKIR